MYQLKLYVIGTEKAKVLTDELRQVLDEDIDGQYSLEVVDLLATPQLAEDDQIFATPTLVKQLPAPVARVIGNFGQKEKVLVGLGLKPLKKNDAP